MNYYILDNFECIGIYVFVAATKYIIHRDDCCIPCWSLQTCRKTRWLYQKNDYLECIIFVFFLFNSLFVASSLTVLKAQTWNKDKKSKATEINMRDLWLLLYTHIHIPLMLPVNCTFVINDDLIFVFSFYDLRRRCSYVLHCLTT